MKLTVVGTGSSGNCYILENKHGAILLDAGLPISKIRRAVRDWSKVGACFVTHEHGDHAQAVPALCRRGIVCYMSPGTRAILLNGEKPDYAGNIECVRASDLVITDTGFHVMPFAVKHDASDPLGYMIKDHETNKILVFATDTAGFYNRFANVSYWLIESNFCMDILERQYRDGTITAQMWLRIVMSHMDMRALADFLPTNDLTKTELIVLCHLSATRSDEARMIDTIQTATGCRTIAAANGLSIDLETVQP